MTNCFVVFVLFIALLLLIIVLLLVSPSVVFVIIIIIDWLTPQFTIIKVFIVKVFIIQQVKHIIECPGSFNQIKENVLLISHIFVFIFLGGKCHKPF